MRLCDGALSTLLVTGAFAPGAKPSWSARSWPEAEVEAQSGAVPGGVCGHSAVAEWAPARELWGESRRWAWQRG